MKRTIVGVILLSFMITGCGSPNVRPQMTKDAKEIVYSLRSHDFKLIQQYQEGNNSKQSQIDLNVISQDDTDKILNFLDKYTKSNSNLTNDEAKLVEMFAQMGKAGSEQRLAVLNKDYEGERLYSSKFFDIKKQVSDEVDSLR